MRNEMDLEVFLPLVGGLRGTEPDVIKGGPQSCGRRNETDTTYTKWCWAWRAWYRREAPPTRFGEDP